VLRLLLGRGAVVDATSSANGFTAFHAACCSNHPGCAEALARAGCDVSIKTGAGFTGLELAEAKDSKGVLRRLRSLARQPFVGVVVELAGLVGAAEHNGKRATVRRHLPEKQRYTLELLEPPAGGGGAGQRMDVRPANFVLAHLPAHTRVEVTGPLECPSARKAWLASFGFRGPEVRPPTAGTGCSFCC
jgi:hypothetical protein